MVICVCKVTQTSLKHTYLHYGFDYNFYRLYLQPVLTFDNL